MSLNDADKKKRRAATNRRYRENLLASNSAQLEQDRANRARLQQEYVERMQAMGKKRYSIWCQERDFEAVQEFVKSLDKGE
jgi:hypothetical protein